MFGAHRARRNARVVEATDRDSLLTSPAFHDANASDSVDFAEFVKAVKVLQYDFTTSVLSLLFGILDQDGSGAIDTNEFDFFKLLIFEARTSFNQYDKDGSGSINHNELYQSLQALGYGFSRDQIQDILVLIDPKTQYELTFEEFVSLDLVLKHTKDVFNQTDTDESNSISFQELSELIVNKMGLKANEAEIRSLFQLLDTDRSGELSFEEFVRFIGKLLYPQYNQIPRLGGNIQKRALLIHLETPPKIGDMRRTSLTDYIERTLAKFGFQQSNISCLSAAPDPRFPSTVNSAELPTRTNILNELRKLLQESANGDSLFVYYSGRAVKTEYLSFSGVGLQTYDEAPISQFELFELLVHLLPKQCQFVLFTDCRENYFSLELKYEAGEPSVKRSLKDRAKKALAMKKKSNFVPAEPSKFRQYLEKHLGRPSMDVNAQEIVINSSSSSSSGIIPDLRLIHFTNPNPAAPYLLTDCFFRQLLASKETQKSLTYAKLLEQTAAFNSPDLLSDIAFDLTSAFEL